MRHRALPISGPAGWDLSERMWGFKSPPTGHIPIVRRVNGVATH
jgi:hypothetical protein